MDKDMKDLLRSVFGQLACREDRQGHETGQGYVEAQDHQAQDAEGKNLSRE